MHIPRSVSALRFQTCKFYSDTTVSAKSNSREELATGLQMCTHLNNKIASEIKKFKAVMPRGEVAAILQIDVREAPEYPPMTATTSMTPARTWY